MTKEEILEKYTEWEGCIAVRSEEDILKAMDEYGRQCFEAGIDAHASFMRGNYRFDIDKFYQDYIKEMEDEMSDLQ